MVYKIMYKCELCGQKFQKGVTEINHLVSNNNLGPVAAHFQDRMSDFKKHPVHICKTAGRNVIKVGVGEFIGLVADKDE